MKTGKIYVVRHGETDYNKQGLLQGRIDVPLNEVGLEQAKEAAEKLSKVPLEKIYVSPLTRAQQTARGIIAGHPNATAETAPELIERAFGDCEGKPGNTVPPYMGLWGLDVDEIAREHSAETVGDLRERIYPFLDRVCREPGNTCLVGHGGTALIIREYFEGTPKSGNLLDFPRVGNGEVMEFEKRRQRGGF